MQSTTAAEEFTPRSKQTNPTALLGLSHSRPWGTLAETETSLQTALSITTMPVNVWSDKAQASLSVTSRGHQGLISAANGTKRAQLHEVQTKATTLRSGKAGDREEPKRAAVGEHCACGGWAGHGAGSSQSSLLSHRLCNPSDCFSRRLVSRRTPSW